MRLTVCVRMKLSFNASVSGLSSNVKTKQAQERQAKLEAAREQMTRVERELNLKQDLETQRLKEERRLVMSEPRAQAASGARQPLQMPSEPAASASSDMDTSSNTRV